MVSAKQAIIAYLVGEADEDECLHLAKWRAASPANEREFQRISQVWSALGDFRWHADGVPRD